MSEAYFTGRLERKSAEDNEEGVASEDGIVLVYGIVLVRYLARYTICI
jgi:hypothetical protein